MNWDRLKANLSYAAYPVTCALGGVLVFLAGLALVALVFG